jgi:hypothetical protein
MVIRGHLLMGMNVIHTHSVGIKKCNKLKKWKK